MEVYNWLEPSIKARIKEIKDECKIQYRKIASEFEKVHQEVIRECPEVFDELLRLETLFIEKDEYVDLAYRSGFKEGLELVRHIQGK